MVCRAGATPSPSSSSPYQALVHFCTKVPEGRVTDLNHGPLPDGLQNPPYSLDVISHVDPTTLEETTSVVRLGHNVDIVVVNRVDDSLVDFPLLFDMSQFAPQFTFALAVTDGLRYDNHDNCILLVGSPHAIVTDVPTSVYFFSSPPAVTLFVACPKRDQTLGQATPYWFDPIASSISSIVPPITLTTGYTKDATYPTITISSSRALSSSTPSDQQSQPRSFLCSLAQSWLSCVRFPTSSMFLASLEPTAAAANISNVAFLSSSSDASITCKYVPWNASSLSFQTAPKQPPPSVLQRILSVADYTGSGFLDILILDAQDRVQIIPGNADLTFDVNSAVTIEDKSIPSGSSLPFTSVDVNNDAALDVVLMVSETLYWYPNLGEPSGLIGVPTYIGAIPQTNAHVHVMFGQMNRDSFLDPVVLYLDDDSTLQIHVYTNHNGSSFSSIPQDGADVQFDSAEFFLAPAFAYGAELFFSPGDGIVPRFQIAATPRFFSNSNGDGSLVYQDNAVPYHTDGDNDRCITLLVAASVYSRIIAPDEMPPTDTLPGSGLIALCTTHDSVSNLALFHRTVRPVGPLRRSGSIPTNTMYVMDYPPELISSQLFDLSNLALPPAPPSPPPPSNAPNQLGAAENGAAENSPSFASFDGVSLFVADGDRDGIQDIFIFGLRDAKHPSSPPKALVWLASPSPIPGDPGKWTRSELVLPDLFRPTEVVDVISAGASGLVSIITSKAVFPQNLYPSSMFFQPTKVSVPPLQPNIPGCASPFSMGCLAQTFARATSSCTRDSLVLSTARTYENCFRISPLTLSRSVIITSDKTEWSRPFAPMDLRDVDADQARAPAVIDCKDKGGMILRVLSPANVSMEHIHASNAKAMWASQYGSAGLRVDGLHAVLSLRDTVLSGFSSETCTNPYPENLFLLPGGVLYAEKGGAITVANGGTLQSFSSRFEECRTVGAGGVVALVASSKQPSRFYDYGSTFVGNSAAGGGALFAQGGSEVHMFMSIFEGNIAGAGGVVAVISGCEAAAGFDFGTGRNALDLGHQPECQEENTPAKATVTFTNITVAGNKVSYGGFGYFCGARVNLYGNLYVPSKNNALVDGGVWYACQNQSYLVPLGEGNASAAIIDSNLFETSTTFGNPISTAPKSVVWALPTLPPTILSVGAAAPYSPGNVNPCLQSGNNGNASSSSQLLTRASLGLPLGTMANVVLCNWRDTPVVDESITLEITTSDPNGDESNDAISSWKLKGKTSITVTEEGTSFKAVSVNLDSLGSGNVGIDGDNDDLPALSLWVYIRDATKIVTPRIDVLVEDCPQNEDASQTGIRQPCGCQARHDGGGRGEADPELAYPQCECPPNSFPEEPESPWSPCVPCVSGATCQGNRSPPQSLEGYFPVGPDDFEECSGSSDDGRSPCLAGAVFDSANDVKCVVGTRSRMCAQCAVRYFRKGGECKKCKTSSKYSVLAGAGVSTLVLFLLYFYLFRHETAHDAAIRYKEVAQAAAAVQELDSAGGDGGGHTHGHDGGGGGRQDVSWRQWVHAIWRVVASLVDELIILGVMAGYGLAEAWEVACMSLAVLIIACVLAINNISMIYEDVPRLRLLSRTTRTYSEDALKALLIFLQTVYAAVEIGSEEGGLASVALRFSLVLEHINLTMTGLECMGTEDFSISFPERFYILLGIVPVILLALVVGVWVRSWIDDSLPHELVVKRAYGIGVSLMYFFFYPLVTACLSVFPCELQMDAESHTKKHFMKNAPWIVCGSSTHSALVVTAVATLILLGLAVVFAFRKLRGRHLLLVVQHAKAVGVEEGGRGRRATTLGGGEAHETPLLHALEFMLEPYNDDYWWFEVVVLARRAAVAFVAAILPRTGMAFPVLILVLCLALGTQYVLKPFQKDQSETIGLAGALVTVYVIQTAVSSESKTNLMFSVLFATAVSLVSIILFWNVLRPILRPPDATLSLWDTARLFISGQKFSSQRKRSSHLRESLLPSTTDDPLWATVGETSIDPYGSHVHPEGDLFGWSDRSGDDGGGGVGDGGGGVRHLPLIDGLDDSF